MKVLGVLVQNDDGKLAFVKADEGSVFVAPNVDVPGGVVDSPSPAKVKYDEAVKVKEANVNNVLAKYKEE